jgi:thioredoxin-dependent peroxiredoxin
MANQERLMAAKKVNGKKSVAAKKPVAKAKPKSSVQSTAAKKPAVKTPSAKPNAAKPSPKAEKSASSSEIALLEVGVSAPDFRLTSDAGTTVTLSSLRGKTVVLYFYPKDSTPGCTVEACDFRDNLARLTAKGALVFGVSADSVESHQKFKQKQSLNFPLLSDPEKKALNAYKVWQEKSLYGRKFMGILRTTYVINGQGKITHVFPKVKVAGHVDQILKVL